MNRFKLSMVEIGSLDELGGMNLGEVRAADYAFVNREDGTISLLKGMDSSPRLLTRAEYAAWLREKLAYPLQRLAELEAEIKGQAGPIMLRFNFAAHDFDVESWCVCPADKWITLKADFIRAIADGDFSVPLGEEEINFGSAAAFLACVAEVPWTWGGIKDIEDKHPNGKVWGSPVDVVKVMENAVAWAAR